MIAGVYSGSVKQGVRDGPGRLEWSNGDYFEGTFKNGLRHGQGVMVEHKQALKPKKLNVHSRPHIQTQTQTQTQTQIPTHAVQRYEGEWALSQRQGLGTQTYANGDVYVGEFSHDVPHGRGELVTAVAKYSGDFKDGLRHGVGSSLFKTGVRYEGEWVKGRFHGKGFYVWPNGNRYEGQWDKGERTGEGVLTFPNGEKYDGLFLRNKKHGAGWWKFTSGKVRPGEWKEDEMIRWTGPEQYEAQMKAKKMKGKLGR